MSDGFAAVRIYQNTTNSIPVGVFTDFQADFIGTATSTVNPGVSYDYDNGLRTISGLTPGTKYWFWVELIDDQGNSSGILSLGSITTASAAGATDIPALTGPTSFGYTVTPSSEFSGTFPGWAAFNRVNGTAGGWASLNGQALPQSLKIQLPAAQQYNSFRAWNTQAWSGRLITEFNIQGSNDDVTYTTLGTYTGVTYTTISDAAKASDPFFQADFDSDNKAGEDESYLYQNTITNPGSYLYYFIEATAINVPGTFASWSEFVLLP